MATNALQHWAGAEAAGPASLRLPPVPWRDPHTVSPEQLAEYIAMLESACEENPDNANLRTCLGMAFALYEMKVVLAEILASTEEEPAV